MQIPRRGYGSASGDLMLTHFARIAWLLAAVTLIPAMAAESVRPSAGARALQDLLYGEALYASENQDPLVAISRLLDSRRQGSGAELPPSQLLILARLALRYGLYDEAKSILRSIPRQQVDEEALNRAWYELARVDFNRGEAGGALDSLRQVDGSLSSELDADRRLLMGQTLLALERNEEAAAVLADWRGPAIQSAYAKYNRGVALLRSGQERQGVRSLEQVWKIRGDSEELLALKDKSNLALGYALAQQGDLDRAGGYLERVRLQGPFSNAALLALGWLELERGQPGSALRPWQALRDRSASDPAVQESMLTVPAVKRDLNQLSGAARDYEAAVGTYTQELDQLAAASESLLSGTGLASLLGAGALAGGANAAPSVSGSTGRYLGEMMAGGSYQAMVRDYGDLALVEKSLAGWVDSVEALDGVLSGRVPPDITHLPGTTTPPPLSPGPRSKRDGRTPSARLGAATPEAVVPESYTFIEPPRRPPPTSKQKPRSKQGYADLELPPEGQVTPLPGSEVIWLPGEPDGSGLPSADDGGLPPDPGYLGAAYGGVDYLPGRPEWRRQGDQYAWMPYPPFDPRRPPQINAATPMPPLPAYLNKNPVPLSTTDRSHSVPGGLSGLGDAIVGVARRSDALQHTLDTMPYADGDIRARLASLRDRIAALRPRVERTMALHEEYLRQLALNELERREQRLKAYLERARFDLARTYDLATQE